MIAPSVRLSRNRPIRGTPPSSSRAVVTPSIAWYLFASVVCPWAWRSMNPGLTTLPDASSNTPPCFSRFWSTSREMATISFRTTPTSRTASSPVSGSMTRPPVITRSRSRSWASSAAGSTRARMRAPERREWLERMRAVLLLRYSEEWRLRSGLPGKTPSTRAPSRTTGTPSTTTWATPSEKLRSSSKFAVSMIVSGSNTVMSAMAPI